MSDGHQQAPVQSGRLLNSKLMPPRLHAGVIPRPRLLARLDEALQRRLTLVSAPTGFGKTTLASMWIAQRDFPSAWVTLDEHDNDPTRFWTYLISALRTLDASLGKDSLSALASPQPQGIDSFLTPLLNDLTRLQPTCVLALEDYHAITSSEVHTGLSFLIQHLPPALHILLVTRSDPDLPLAVLRARDELVEIHAADLRFDEKETEAFLRQMVRQDLSPEAVTRLFERSEGWAAGLRLAALSMGNKIGPADIERLIEHFSGNDRYIADYLIKEVFEAQPADVQSFLLETCFFSRLTGSLCDTVTGLDHSAALLERMERDNLFIVQLERGGRETWYRYSPLFAESLQYVAGQRLTNGEAAGLLEKASGWYEANGMYEEAIETALSARLFQQAMTLIERFIDIHDIGELRTLARWLESIPQDLLLQHPIICFTYAQIILYTGDRFAPITAVRLEPFLQSAEAAWRAAGDEQRLGEVLSLRGTVALWQGDFEKGFAYAHQALEILPEHDVLYRGSSLLITGREALDAGRILAAQDMTLEARAQMGAARNIHGVLAAIQMQSEVALWQGELELAEQLNQQILAEAIGGDEMLDDRGTASLALADVAYEQNDIERAQGFAEETLDLGNRRGNEMLQVGGVIRLARVLAAQDDRRGADDLLRSFAARVNNPVFLREVQAEQAKLSILAGDTLSLAGWVAMVSSEKQSLSAVQKEREAFTLARLQIAQGKAAEALPALRHWQADAAENGRIRSQIEACILESLAHHAQSNLPKASKSLVTALKLGQPKGFRRSFIDEGPRMASLLKAVSSGLGDRALGLYASTLLHSFNTELIAEQSGPSPIEPLSQQEIRVLRLLAAGLSNTDIAQELVVSTNTVKTHVKSIYRKLGITSRAEARDMARGLRLL